ncbi:ECF RNA polymerase sigma factor SigG [bacterium BMS3Abin02]|nr:ECF RNA polymerase sigma factor SigG [bacterium BMS3Abin02]GBE21609.1 ECF RNA polymerase sigma factor SigG [bacterium BMS3Bbin01]
MPGADKDLDALVPALRRRDPVAFRRLYEALADSLGGFAFGMLRDRLAAEDAVQQAFLEFVKAAPDLVGDGRSVRAWLYRSVRFTCLDEIRRRSRRPEQLMDVLPEPESRGADPVDMLFDPDLEAAFATLTPHQRTVVLLRHVAGMSGAEVAKVVGSNRAAVYAMIARAEASLRRALSPVESDGVAASEPVKGKPAFGRTHE